jgi:hypothetical protein
MHQSNTQMQSCIAECLACYQSCFGMAMTHCLEQGGKHTDPEHFRLMIACAQMCKTAADFMLMNSPHHKHTCGECAEICHDCAQSCEQIGGMQECVEACRRCADSCLRMAA